MSENPITNNGITSGVIWKQLLSFFFPILFGTIFQQLYNTVDAVIVGKFLGKQALAAVGGGTSVAINLLIGFFVGLSSGATVIISQYYGAQDENNVRKAIHNACAIALWGGIIVSIAGYFTSEALLKSIGTPFDVMPLAIDYMHIYFAGTVVVVIYNIGSGIFRAFGDSKSPLIFLIAGCIANIGLDLLFIGVFNWGVKGAAYATVLSQLVSTILVIAKLRQRQDCCHLYYSQIKFNSLMLRKTVSIGLPAGIQSVMYSLSNLLIQASINGFGTDAAAAWAAYGKLDCLFWMIISAFGIAITTFVGQNYGAALYSRAKKGVKVCLFIAFISTGLLEVLYLLFAKYGYLLFTDDQNVIELGIVMLKAIAPFYFTYICVEILSGAIRGTGKTLLPTIFTVFGICGFRVIWLSIIPRYSNTIVSVVTCYPVTWVLTSILFILYYCFGKIYPKEIEA